MIFVKEPMLVEEKKAPITNQDMFNAIVNMLKTKSEYNEAAAILDYANPCYKEIPLRTESCYPEIIAAVNPGGSEGIYIDWYLKYKFEGFRIGTFKTLDESMDGYIAMGKISGMLIWASEQYLSFNDGKIEENNKEVHYA